MNKSNHYSYRILILILSAGVLFLSSCGSSSSGYDIVTSLYFTQINLVSDGYVGAAYTDTKLINPWGIAFSPSGPFWVADNGTGVTTVYNGAGQKYPLTPYAPLVVTISPPAGSAPGTVSTPTGLVYNAFPGFDITDPVTTATDKSLFIFATEDGTISGWNATVNVGNAILAVDKSGSAIYKGLAINGDGTRLYAANFLAGTIDVFDNRFHLINTFGDTMHSPGTDSYSPFNIWYGNDGRLYVSFAKLKAGTHDDEAGPGNGFVDVFDQNGVLIIRLISNGMLNSPWGMALAPANFGQFSNALLVGNFGDGMIHAFDPATGNHLGHLLDSRSNPIVIDGLWALTFGNGGFAGKTNELFFTAGSNDEKDGLFGKIVVY